VSDARTACAYSDTLEEDYPLKHCADSVAAVNGQIQISKSCILLTEAKKLLFMLYVDSNCARNRAQMTQLSAEPNAADLGYTSHVML
jgi:hypothetical protein